MSVRAGSGSVSASVRARSNSSAARGLSTMSSCDAFEEGEDRLPQRLDLLGGHDPLGDAEQDDRHAVVVRRPDAAVRLNAGAEIAQRARQVAVAAERQHEAPPVAQCRDGGDDRQAAGEADAHDCRSARSRAGVTRAQSGAAQSAASSIMSVVRGVIW